MALPLVTRFVIHFPQDSVGYGEPAIHEVEGVVGAKDFIVRKTFSQDTRMALRYRTKIPLVWVYDNRMLAARALIQRARENKAYCEADLKRATDLLAAIETQFRAAAQE